MTDPHGGSVYAIAPTPFREDGSVDFSSIDRLAEFYEGAGVSGITVLGQLGEAAKLDHEEAVTVAARFIKSTRLPVIVGVSAAGFAAMRALALPSMEAGAAGVMILPPAGLINDEATVGYYHQAARTLGRDVPFVIQDHPQSSHVYMSAEVIRRIVTDNAACMMLKHEDWPGLEKLSEVRALQEAGRMRNVPILCGNSGVFLDFELERGADGAMTGYAFPEALVELIRHSGKSRDSLHDYFNAHLPLMRYDQQPGVGLAARKYILKRRGLLTSDAQRPPSRQLSETGRQEVEYMLAKLRGSLPESAGVCCDD